MAKGLKTVRVDARALPYDIGTAAAENDGLLNSCFHNTGDFDVMRNIRSPKSILVGRTGIGKSALVGRLSNEENHVIVVRPDALSLPHICNSPVLKFYEEQGVRLDPFYRLLWQHIIVVELLRYKYDIKNEEDQNSFLRQISASIRRDKNKVRALEFLKKWGDQFWNEIGVRTTQFRETLEGKLEAKLKGKMPGFDAGIGGARHITQEQKRELAHYGQSVVDKVQIKDLTNIIRLLADDIFTERGDNYYVVIDELDEAWAPTDILRFNLIRALIGSIKDFREVPTVKVIAAMRSDLLESVYNATRGPGFQEEKFKDFCLDIQWKDSDIIKMLNLRIQHFDRLMGGNGNASLQNKLPSTQGVGGKGREPAKYFVERTLMRPRNAILFFNACLAAAKNKDRFTWNVIYQAEKEYSVGRMKSLKEEWGNIYPNVLGYVKILENKPVSFKVSDITKKEIHDLFTDRLCEEDSYTEDDPLCKSFEKHIDGHMSFPDFRHELIKVLYKMEVIGIQKKPSDAVSYSFKGSSTLARAEARENFTVCIHPAFRKGVGTKEKDPRNKK